jgi:hypothetical protein
MNTPEKLNMDDYNDLFDRLSSLGINVGLDKDENVPHAFFEALDYVANYCGDKAHGREVTFEKLADAFPSVREEARREAYEEGARLQFENSRVEIAEAREEAKRERDEEIETMREIIKSIQSYSPDGEIGTLCEQALSNPTNE